MLQEVAMEAVLRARANAAGRERLIDQHRGFIAQVASSVCRRRLDWQNDDELSVALIAFNDAIDHYRPEAGVPFLAYASLVIRRRLVDHFRARARRPETVLPAAPDDEPEGRGATGVPEVGGAWEAFREEEARRARAEEIGLFAARLRRWGITLAALADRAPSHRDTRETCARVARVLAGDPALRRVLWVEGRYPAVELAKRAGVGLKLVKQWRPYLIGLAAIMADPDLDTLRAFFGLPYLGEAAGAGRDAR